MTLKDVISADNYLGSSNVTNVHLKFAWNVIIHQKNTLNIIVLMDLRNIF